MGAGKREGQLRVYSHKQFGWVNSRFKTAWRRAQFYAKSAVFISSSFGYG
jgi:hypothetical protein